MDVVAAKRKPPPIPRNLRNVLKFLNYYGLEVYGPNYQPPHEVYPAHRNFDADLIRRYVSEVRKGTLKETDHGS